MLSQDVRDMALDLKDLDATDTSPRKVNLELHALAFSLERIADKLEEFEDQLPKGEIL